jgi:hypothetical protein
MHSLGYFLGKIILLPGTYLRRLKVAFRAGLNGQPEPITEEMKVRRARFARLARDINIATGGLFVGVGLAAALYAYLHRPPENARDLVQRAKLSFLARDSYQGLLLGAAVVTVIGIVSIATEHRKS